MQHRNRLVDPTRITSLTSGEIDDPECDKRVLRTLGERLAAIVVLAVQAETGPKWRALNGSRQARQMVWIDEIPRRDMNVDDELRPQTMSKWSRHHEWELRQLIYQWELMPEDMGAEAVVYYRWWSTIPPSVLPKTWISP